jgi:hypothetical protein
MDRMLLETGWARTTCGSQTLVDELGCGASFHVQTLWGGVWVIRLVVLLSLLPHYTGDISHHCRRWEIAGCKASTERKMGRLMLWWIWVCVDVGVTTSWKLLWLADGD